MTGLLEQVKHIGNLCLGGSDGMAWTESWVCTMGRCRPGEEGLVVQKAAGWGRRVGQEGGAGGAGLVNFRGFISMDVPVNCFFFKFKFQTL